MLVLPKRGATPLNGSSLRAVFVFRKQCRWFDNVTLIALAAAPSYHVPRTCPCCIHNLPFYCVTWNIRPLAPHNVMPYITIDVRNPVWIETTVWLFLLYICHTVIHKKLQNVVYMKNIDVKNGGWAISGTIGFCPQVPVIDNSCFKAWALH